MKGTAPKMKLCHQQNMALDTIRGTAAPVVPGLNCAIIGLYNNTPVYAMDCIVLHYMQHESLDYDQAFQAAMEIRKKAMVIDVYASYGMFTGEEMGESTGRIDTMVALPALMPGHLPE